jgi:thymidylate kinase
VDPLSPHPRAAGPDDAGAQAGAGGDRESLLRGLEEKLPARLIRWRDSGIGGSDIDLLALAAAADLTTALVDAGLRPRFPGGGRITWHDGLGPPLDVMPASQWPDHYPALDAVLRRLLREPGLPRVLSAEDRALVFAADIVAGRSIVKMQAQTARLAAGGLDRPRLAQLAATEGFGELPALVLHPERWGRSVRRGRLGYGRSALLAMSSVKARSALRARLAAIAVRVVRRIQRARGERDGLIVALSGIDGSGKSTLAESIASSLKETGAPVEVVWGRLGQGLGSLKGVARAAKRVLRRRDPTADAIAAGGPGAAPRHNAPRSGPVAWTWVVVVAAARLLDFRRAFRGSRAGVACVCDRWTADAIVDLRLRYARHRVAELALRMLSPQPDVALLLELDPAEAIRRKPGDQAADVLATMAALYGEAGDRLGLVRLDASRSAGVVHGEAMALIDEALRARERRGTSASGGAHR